MAEIKKIQPIGSSVQYDLDALHVLYEGGRISSPSAMKADSKLHIYLSSSSMTTDKPPTGDGHILHFAWDNTGGYDNELAIGNNGHLSVRGGQGSGNATNSTQNYTNWNTILDSANYSSYTVKKDGTGATGDWGINITGNAATASSITWSGITGKPNRAGSDSDGGPAQTVKGAYTSNGGQQNPNYFGKNKVGFLMMNTTVNSNSQYKDWIIMDCYSGSDVGGGVAFGVNRQSLGAYIMRSAAARETWAESAELIGTHNYTTYTVKKDGTGATGTWSISISGNAATATALTSSAGSSTVPIYFSSGKPVQCSTTLGVSITGSAASATKASQDGDGNVITSTYVKKSGDTLTDNLLGNAANSLGSTDAPFHNIILGGVTSATMTAASTNPRITFQENTGTQPVHLIYTDYDNYRSPAGLKVIGGSSATPAWFEVEGNVYAAAFKGNADTATKLATARSLKTKLDSTTAVTFDGSAAQDAIPVIGTLGVANGGTGATTLTSGAALIGNGTGAVTTRSIRNNTSIGALGWTAQATDTTLVTTNTIAYWNGAYSGTISNLQYYKGGAFGTMAKETATDYPKKSELLDLIYPIGAIYISATSTSPATLFGGIWEQIEGKFLLASDTNYEAGTTGGSATVTLETANLPSHTHPIGAHAHSLNSHTHSVGAHAHSLNAHTHAGPSHTHTGPSHTHTGPSHTHSGPSHTHSGPNHSHSMSHSHSARIVGITNNQGNTGTTWGNYRMDSRWNGICNGDPKKWDGYGDGTISVSLSANTGGGGTGATGASGTGQTGASGTGATGASGTGATGASGTGATGGPSVANTGNSTAFNSGGPSTTNTGNSTAFDSGATGSGTAHNNMPPYLSVYVWQRTA